jgi:hypothetical protein
MVDTATDRSRKRTAMPEEEAPKAQQGQHVCQVAFCPIGLALSAVQGAAPDVLEHLLAAAREFLLATKAVVDARSADLEEPKPSTRMEKIEIG